MSFERLLYFVTKSVSCNNLSNTSFMLNMLYSMEQQKYWWLPGSVHWLCLSIKNKQYVENLLHICTLSHFPCLGHNDGHRKKTFARSRSSGKLVEWRRWCSYALLFHSTCTCIYKFHLLMFRSRQFHWRTKKTECCLPWDHFKNMQKLMKDKTWTVLLCVQFTCALDKSQLNWHLVIIKIIHDHWGKLIHSA